MIKRYVFGAILLTAVVALFVWGAVQQSQQVNTDLNKTDQKAYINYARKLKETNYQYIGTRARMPLYPLLMSAFYQEGMSDEAFFARGKQVNIGLVLLVLAVLLGILWWYARPFEAIVATLVAAFTVFVYKAPYFQAEPLFYGFSFGLFVLLLELVSRPRLTLAAAAGVVAALAHLTKASILPAVALAGVCLGVLMLLRWRRASSQQELGRSMWWRQIILSVGIFSLIFLAILYPYLRTSKEVYGRYFYNVNSTFYIWYDSWEEVRQGTNAHGDRDGWPDMPPEEIPSMSKYLREHTIYDILTRLGWGLVVVTYSAVVSSGYFTFVLLYIMFLGIVLWQNWSAFWHLVNQTNRLPTIIFICGYFVGYLLLYAWFTPISAGSRFTLALFLPAMFVFTLFIDLARRRQFQINLFGSTIPAPTMSLFILLLLIVYLATEFPFRIDSFYGGY